MVMKMNKKKFIELLQDRTKLSYKECETINNILESNFIFSKKNKDKIISDIQMELNLEKEKVENIYDISMDIISVTLKDKLKHPFKSQD